MPLTSWTDFYGASPMTQAAMLFGHLAGLMAGGGAALHADRATLRLHPTWPEIQRHLGELRHTHPVVLIALGIMVLTGGAMLLADLDRLIVLPVFWTKMAVVALLLLNGARMRRLESRLLAGVERPGRTWRSLRYAAMRSAGLWLALVLLGVLLPIFS